VVTLSATFGAGGSVVGPRVAELLDVPFLDRAIAVEVSRHLAVPLDEALARDERAEHGLGRLLASFASVPLAPGAAPPPTVLEERQHKEEAERVIHAHASEGAVVLGRAAALVLADHPHALHVRLDGPCDARIAQAMRLGALDEAEARRRQRDADRARTAYVKHFYRADPADPALYHVMLDSTAIDLETCAEVIATLARVRPRSS
jgi:hypothetical protein